MSFRTRLTLFFALLVGVPLLAVAVISIRVSSQLDEGRLDARLGQGMKTATRVFRAERRTMQSDVAELADLLRRERAWQLHPSRIAELIRPSIQDGSLRSATLMGRGRKEIRILGEDDGLNAARIGFVRARGDQVRALLLSSLSAAAYVERVASLTGEEVVLSQDGRLLAATGDAGIDDAESGDVRIGDRDARALKMPIGSHLELSLIALRDDRTSAFESRPAISAAFVALALLSILFGTLTYRSMHRQLAQMMATVHQIRQRRHGARVRLKGGDEFAAVGGALNEMANELERQFERVESQRDQLHASVQRLGQALASGYDIAETLQLSLTLLVEAVGADFGQLSGADGGQKVRAGELLAADLPSEARLLLEQSSEEAGEDTRLSARDQWSAMSRLLHAQGAEAVIILIRRERGFDQAELEIFNYLSSSIQDSLANLDLVEELARQANSDQLTGLPNRRYLDGALAAEHRRRGAMALLMIDIDDFKAINDKFGHAVGDRALQLLAEILSSTTRSADTAARWGGEEFVVLLPGSDAQGALEVAEKIRTRLSERATDPPFSVSIGVAAGSDAPELLLERADHALYEAKRTGKDRSVVNTE